MIREVLTCGVASPVGGMAPGTALERHDLSLTAFPDALCNDGTGAVIYFRPHMNAPNQDRWVIQFVGGGSCNTPQECADRWCHVNTGFSMTQMTSDVAPAGGTIEQGIFARVGGNVFGNWNQVLVRYCSSDEHAGRARDVTIAANDPVTGAPVQFRMHFLGASIVDAAIATLRADGVPPLVYASTNTTMPDLDSAQIVVFAGASAGGLAVLHHVDRLAADLRTRSPNVVVDALVDSAFGPDLGGLDFTSTAACTQTQHGCDYASYLADRSAARPYPLVDDESCETHHAANPTDVRRCEDSGHVLRNHITTPMFVRMGQRDSLVSTLYVGELALPGHGPMTIDDFAAQVRTEITDLANLPTSAEEVGAISVAPGAFSPTCSKHETLRDTPNALLATITSGAMAYTMEQVITSWSTRMQPSILVTPVGGTEFCP